MRGFVMSPELINRKIGISFPRHQQHQQLGSERPQRLPVDQLDLFARLQVSNLRRGECKPTSDHLILANKTNRGTYTQTERVSLFVTADQHLERDWSRKYFCPPYSSAHKPKLHPLIFHAVNWKTLLWFSLLCSFFLAVFLTDRQQVS